MPAAIVFMPPISRRLRLREADGSELHISLREMIRTQESLPGAAAPLACDPFRLHVMLADGGIWALSLRQPAVWRAQNREAQVTQNTDAAPRILAVRSGARFSPR